MKRTLIVAAFLAAGCSTAVDDSRVDEQELTETEEIIENLKLAGYPEQEIEVLPDGTVVVGQDAVVNLQASREMAGIGYEDDFRQYRTFNLVNTNSVNVICVNPTAGFNNLSTLSAALDVAIARYNVLQLGFTMQRGGGGCDANITIDDVGGSGGLAGFPSGGQPYPLVEIGNQLNSSSVEIPTHVIQHELGHCIGFRHTDYFNRSISCGGFPLNEGEENNGVGAVHIPGTPTTNINSRSSVMVACFSNLSTGLWTDSDLVACEELYGTNSFDITASAVDTQSNLSGSAGSQVVFGPYDGASVDALRFAISGGTGDVDLYVRLGAAPTTATFDCRPYFAGNEESCNFAPTDNGDYYVMLDAFEAYTGVTLSVTAPSGGPPPPDPEVCDDGTDNDGDGDTDCADSDCAADPACAPDPEVCDDGTDNDGDGDTDCADSDCAADPACAPDPEVCDDGTDNDGDGDTDCADSDCAADPACAPGGFTELFFNGFENGWGNFNDGGSDARRSANDAQYATTGTFCARIRDDSSTSVITSDPFSLSPYTEVQIEFAYYARSMENNEDFFVELWNGSSWVVVGNYVRNQDFDNNTFNTATINVTSGQVNFSGSAQLRFRNDASGNQDWIYIDDVTVSAQ